jgi:hypothetical protein
VVLGHCDGAGTGGGDRRVRRRVHLPSLASWWFRRARNCRDQPTSCEHWSLVSVVGSDGQDQLSVEVRDPSWRKAGLPEDRPRPWCPGIVNNVTGEGVDILHGKDSP